MHQVKIRILPTIGFISCIYLFFIAMSHDFYPINTIGYAIFGAILIAICFFYTIKGLQDLEDFNTSVSKFSPRKFLLFYIFLLSAVVFIIVTVKLTYLYSSIKEKELKQFGQITTGKIIEGYSVTAENISGTYTVTVEYTPIDGETTKAITRVSPAEFKEYYVDKKVQIIYSTKNNSLIDLLTNDDKIKKYTKIENKEITLTLLLKIVNIKQSDIGIYLNKISYQWEFDNSKKSWINNQKDILISINDDKSISYFCAFTDPKEINNEIHFLKFKKIDTSISKNVSEGEKIKMHLTSSDGIYENETFGLVIKTLPIGKNGQLGTIINVFKK